MVSRVTLPDARIPIGHCVINGMPVAVEVDIEWMRAFTDLLTRTGGTTAPSTPDVIELINAVPPMGWGSDTDMDSGSGGGIILIPSGPAELISVKNEATDTTCFPIFVTAATGDLGAKTNAALTFNSLTGTLDATLFDGPASQVVVANEATDTTCFVTFVTDATGNLAEKSNANLTFNSNTNAFATGSVRAVGGEAPGVAADAVHAWVTGGTPILTLANPSNAADARLVSFSYGTGGGGTLSGTFNNDAFGVSRSWIDVVGTSAAIASVSFPQGTVNVTGGTLTLAADTQLSRTAANRIGIPDAVSVTTGGVAPSVAASNVNVWTSSGGSPQIDFIEAANGANGRISNFVFSGTSFLGRFINDAYNAATNWVSVIGTSASITSITHPVLTVSALTAGRVTFAGTGGLLSDSAALTYVSGTGTLTATAFVGALTGTATVATTATVANEATDTTCFITFVTDATGNLGQKSNANLTFNSNTNEVTFGGNLQLANLTFTGSLQIFPTGGFYIRSNTADGADDAVVYVTGGGSLSETRGAYLGLYGNENGTAVGQAHLVSGDVASAQVLLKSGTSEVALARNGTLTVNCAATLGDAAADTITVTGTPAGQVIGSTYTPTASAATNLDATPTPTEAQYMRVGATVTVSGRFTADPTAPGAASFELTLPVASNIGAVDDCAGVAFCGAIAGQGAAISGSVANNTAVISWIAVDVTSQAWSYTFSYQII